MSGKIQSASASKNAKESAPNPASMYDLIRHADEIAEVCREILNDGLSMSRRRRLRNAIDEYAKARSS